MKRSIDKEPSIIDLSTLELFGSKHFAKWPELYTWLVANHWREESLSILGRKLLAVAEHSRTVWANESLEEVATLLTTLPFPEQYRSAGWYYRGLCAGRRKDYQRAEAIYNGVIERSGVHIKARALVSLGFIHQAIKRNLSAAAEAFVDCVRIASSQGALGLRLLVSAKHNLAIIDSQIGDHRGALRNFEKMTPLVQMMGSVYPQEYYNYFNGLAVEMNVAGRLEEAENIINLVLRSPIAHIYPEWYKTREEIVEKRGRASRSFIAVGWREFLGDNTVQIPPCQPRRRFAGPEVKARGRRSRKGQGPASTGNGRPERATRTARRRSISAPASDARILKFPKSKRKNVFERPTDPDKAFKERNSTKLVRIVDLITERMSDEKMDAIIEAIRNLTPDLR
jgi:tetratricopeptide (TPR) repeat protein